MKNTNLFAFLLIRILITCMTFAPSLVLLAEYATIQEENDPLLFWSQGNKHFTTSFYSHAKKDRENFIFSPLSLQLGMATTAELALNATQKEILEKMVLPENAMTRQLGAAKLLHQLHTDSTETEFSLLSLANGAWLSKEVQCPSDFPTLLSQSYQAMFKEADFAFSPEETRQEINSWVEEKTSHQIQELIPAGSIDSQTKLVLVNTLYLRAPWEKPFDSERTYQDVFYSSETSLIPVFYMRRSAVFGYLEDAKQIVVELPFKQSKTHALSLFVILPKEDSSLEELEGKLTTRRLDHWLTNIEQCYLDISLPKFKVSSAIHAKEILQELGLHLPFSSQAEFDFKGEDKRMAITHLLHQAVFEIDEEGGIGSAGTGIIIGPTFCPGTKEIKINRPFLILVADKTSGIVLFAGRITQPKN